MRRKRRRRRGCFAASSAGSVGVIMLMLLLVCVAEEENHSSNDDSRQEANLQEEGRYFEAAAVYSVGTGTNFVVAVPPEVSFEEETFAFMVVPAASADLAGLQEAAEDAETAWYAFTGGTEEPTFLAPGEPATPSASLVYQIALEDPLAMVPVNVTTAGAHALLLEHGGDEVGTSLVSPAGVVLVAAAEEGAEEEDEEEDGGSSTTGSQWAHAIGASVIISICSFTGLVAVINKRVAESIVLSHAFLFASGTLLTASLLHIMPEAMEDLHSEHDSAHDLGLYTGVAILGGMCFGVLVHALVESGNPQSKREVLQKAVGVMRRNGDLMPRSLRREGRGGSKAPENGTSFSASPVSGEMVIGNPFDGATARSATPAEAIPANLRALMEAREGRALFDLSDLQPVCWNVIAGDLVHNFADGVTIGAAFLRCSTTIGWTVTASAVLHEVPHELGDFVALLNGGMSVKQAFVYNFLSALSAVLGTITILAPGSSLTDAQISIVLLVGAGSFIFIALTELLPEALTVTAVTRERGVAAVLCSQLRKLGSFTVGAILIGVPLIFDKHCDADVDGHDH